MPSKRKGISKRLRFEIFKRDGFTCRYCGRNPPTVVLNVDHIMPVSKGGTNDLDNLITACFDCNSGKSDKELTILPEQPQKNVSLLKERHEQYKEYQKYLLEFDDLIKIDVEHISSIFINAFELKYFDESRKSSIQLFVEKLGRKNVQDAMTASFTKNMTAYYTWKYFCGICWNMIKNNRKSIDERSEPKEVQNG